MKKEEYLEQIKNITKIPKNTIDLIINEYLELLKLNLIKNKKVSITNFGTFSIKITKPYEYFSPIDGRKIKTSGIIKVFFSSSKQLLNRISG